MNSETINNIILLNRDFYKKVAKSFSRTRQQPWSGWKRVGQVVGEKFKRQEVSVLDLGCGNGRFIDYLHRRFPKINFNYLGLDADEYLLSEAKVKHPLFEFKHCDVINNLHEIPGKYDIVVTFGVTHHIPDKEFRKKWFKTLSELVAPGGILVFTNWNYDVDGRFKAKALKSVKTDEIEINESELDYGDWFLGWNNVEDAYRYVHLYSEEEMNEIITEMSPLQLKETWTDDGRDEDLNRYYLFN